jgi:hypothetical protein
MNRRRFLGVTVTAAAGVAVAPARALAQASGHDVYPRIIPIDEFAVAPDLWRDLHRCYIFSCHNVLLISS